jgi:hypothetical protein
LLRNLPVLIVSGELCGQSRLKTTESPVVSLFAGGRA